MAKAIAVNGSGKAPGKATVEFFQDQGLDHIGLTTAHAVSVAAGWEVAAMPLAPCAVERPGK